MLYLAVASLALAAVTVVCAFQALRWQARAAARDRQSLLAVIEQQTSQLCHLVSRPWTLPPRTFEQPNSKPDSKPEVESPVDEWLPV